VTVNYNCNSRLILKCDLWTSFSNTPQSVRTDGRSYYTRSSSIVQPPMKRLFRLLSTHPTEQLADQLTWHQTQLTTKSWQVTRLAWSMLAVAVCGDLTSGKRNRLTRAVETTVFAKMNLEDLHRVTNSWLLWTLITVNAASNYYIYAASSSSSVY